MQGGSYQPYLHPQDARSLDAVYGCASSDAAWIRKEAESVNFKWCRSTAHQRRGRSRIGEVKAFMQAHQFNISAMRSH